MTKEEALQKIEELKKFIEQQDKNDEGRWKPDPHEIYFFVSGYGEVKRDFWAQAGSDSGYYDMGDCFKTKEEAEAHKMRLISMANRGKRPEHGDTGSYWDFEDNCLFWGNFNSHILLEWWIGNWHKTEEECKKWHEEYGKYWEQE